MPFTKLYSPQVSAGNGSQGSEKNGVNKLYVKQSEKSFKNQPKIFEIYLASGSFVRAKCSPEQLFVFPMAIARTARNCSHQKPNDT
jgi:hypothetical protein